jgi:uncharacterized protein DUF4387
VTSTDSPRLRDLASFIRSKNAGAFAVTIDVFFEAHDEYEQVRDSKLMTPERIGELYGLERDDVHVYAVESLPALKITIPRDTAAGSPGDFDVAAGQQHALLVNERVEPRSSVA